MAKVRLCLTVDAEVKERLANYAEEQHTTMSQAVTDYVVRVLKLDEQSKEKTA